MNFTEGWDKAFLSCACARYLVTNREINSEWGSSRWRGEGGYTLVSVANQGLGGQWQGERKATAEDRKGHF